MTAKLQALKDRIPKGYNFAAVLPPETDPAAIDVFSVDWLPVLRECRGALGVLRGLDHPGRMENLLASLSTDGREVLIVHLSFPINEMPPALLQFWRVRVHLDAPQSPARDGRPNYARDRLAGAAGD